MGVHSTILLLCRFYLKTIYVGISIIPFCVLFTSIAPNLTEPSWVFSCSKVSRHFHYICLSMSYSPWRYHNPVHNQRVSPFFFFWFSCCETSKHKYSSSVSTSHGFWSAVDLDLIRGIRNIIYRIRHIIYDLQCMQWLWKGARVRQWIQGLLQNRIKMDWCDQEPWHHGDHNLNIITIAWSLYIYHHYHASFCGIPTSIPTIHNFCNPNCHCQKLDDLLSVWQMKQIATTGETYQSQSFFVQEIKRVCC